MITSHTDPQTQAILKRLDELAAMRNAPDLAGPVAFYRAALPLLREAQAGIEPFTLDAETAQHKLASGLPLLIGEDLPLDPDATRDLFLRLCRIAETVGGPAPATPKSSGWSLPFKKRSQPPIEPIGGNPQAQRPAPIPSGQVSNGNEAALRAAAVGQIRQAVEQEDLDLSAVWSALAAGEWPRVELTANGLQLDPELLRMLAQNSLKPALRAWAQGLQQTVDLDRWKRGQCPMCGGPPAYSEIQGKEGARRLRCTMCGAGWLYPRLQCAFCATKDYKLLGYLSVAGEEEKYRLQTCDACRGYVKVVVTYDPTPVDLLPVEDLATLHLDLIAAEREFTRAPMG
ncbi:MAG TPA: formate dehydrogenase accessory protein FdhE [Anaerolineales bacterium]|nr:formate dehydrogenase accessory protein FdhE [Anaerolineales bacterium]